MFSKLKKNYNLSNILVRILFVLTFVFAHWQSGLASSVMILGRVDLLVGFATVSVAGTLLMFLVPLLANFLLDLAKIQTVPRSEFCLLLHAFFCLGQFLTGLLGLVNIFTPLLLVWGGVMFPLVASLVAAVLFYNVTSKLYFNDLTRPNYFRLCAVVYLVALLFAEVL